MKINYVLVDPGGNPTVLVLTGIARDLQPKVSKTILDKLPGVCEQVGFIERAQNPKAACRLQMMGGEFCGNALRSTVGWLAQKAGKEKWEKGKFKSILESSGTGELLVATVTINKKNGAVSAEIKFPEFKEVLAKEIFLNIRSIKASAQLVNLPGITQVLLSYKYFNKDINFKRIFENLYKRNQVSAPACGFIFYKQISTRIFSIIPIVYVPKTNSLVFETSCASGSVALGFCSNQTKLEVIQPSESLLNLKIDTKRRRVRVSGQILSIVSGSMHL